MEFTYTNFIETTTSITITNGTLTVANILDPDITLQYITEDFADDATTASITFNFDSTQSVERIAIMGTNLKSFDIFYDGVTANTFALTSTGATTTSQWSNNSETSMYLFTTPTDCTSVTIDLKTTQTANQEKAIGYAVFTGQKLDFDRIPSAKNYKPKRIPKEFVNKLANGGTRVHTLEEKWDCNIKFKYITESFKNSLYSIYQEHQPFMFAGFPTSTGWDGVFFECIWSGKFEFFIYSDDAVNAGFSGQINLKET